MKMDAGRRRAYEYLRERAKSGAEFDALDLSSALNLPKEPADARLPPELARLPRELAPYVEPGSAGRLRVIPEFKRVLWEEFDALESELSRPFPAYVRASYEKLVIYDLLMPLTREDKLRHALDELFYRDTLERRLLELGLDTMAQSIPREAGESDATYASRVIDFIADRIGGFSVSHVSGRYRARRIATREASIADGSVVEPYLQDETSAVVRFIVPCLSSKVVHGADFIWGAVEPAMTDDVMREVRQIRAVFLELFVESLVPTIRGERRIWVLEHSPFGQRLYELDRQR